MNNTITLREIVNRLNEAQKTDPQAISALLCACVPANKELMDHPYIQVSCALGLDYPRLSLLGLLNGLVAPTGYYIGWRGLDHGFDLFDLNDVDGDPIPVEE